MITNQIPAGNIQVVSENGHEIELDVELRDTSRDWFYWCFKAQFPEVGEYNFRFVRKNKVCTHGPAVSYDHGRTWSWLSKEYWTDTSRFSYHCNTPGEEVWFCIGMQYLQRDLEAFLAEYADNPFLHVGELCHSRKGRSVELLSIKEAGTTPDHNLLITSRHHAGEMMATHVLEGILRSVLADDEFARRFRSRIAIRSVPFVDKDGVEDGDQGKNRIPHDHARDYQDPGIYPETTAIRQIIEQVHPDLVLDLHCPWIRTTSNETSYMVESNTARNVQEVRRFASCLEAERIPEAPYFKADNIPFGTSWNTPMNYVQGKSLVRYAETLPFIRCATTIEVPFANFHEVTVDRSAMLSYGATIARAILTYLSTASAKPE